MTEIEAVKLAAEMTIKEYRAERINAVYDNTRNLLKLYGALQGMELVGKTRLTFAHVEAMLGIYRRDNPGAHEAVRLLYVEGLTSEEAAARLHVHKRTVWRHVNEAIEDLAVLLFGIEGVGWL